MLQTDWMSHFVSVHNGLELWR